MDDGWSSIVNRLSSMVPSTGPQTTDDTPSSIVYGLHQEVALFKFERLAVYQAALDYVDRCYGLAERLPEQERYNLAGQLRRAATSVALNIAEGSTGQSDAEQARFLGIALRSLLETVACQHMIARRGYLDGSAELGQAYTEAESLARSIQAMRRALGGAASRLREEEPGYGDER